VNGNPYWLDKPDIQKVNGKTAQGDSLIEYMGVIQESEEDSEIGSPSLIHDVENNVLFNIEKLIFKEKAWYPVIHAYKEGDMWFKYALIFTGMFYSLKNHGFAVGGGYLANSKTGSLGSLFKPSEDMFLFYVEAIKEIQTILAGNIPNKIQPGHCKFCCFENCPDAFKLTGIKRVDSLFTIPLGDK
jgi:hypothetical protein